jgi:cell division protein FtsW
MLGGLGVGGIISAYLMLPHVAGRIDRFWTGEGDTFQVDTAREAIIRGVWFGRGPGEGIVKRIIPDSHTDFIFSVAAEEFGMVFCMFLVAIFAFIVLRGLNTALKEHDDFTRYAVGGLVTVFGLQAVINMCVNLQLVPAKGMTLPFISYGGSSQIAIAISMGMVLALTRKRPEKRKQMGFALSQRALPAE